MFGEHSDEEHEFWLEFMSILNQRENAVFNNRFDTTFMKHVQEKFRDTE